MSLLPVDRVVFEACDCVRLQPFCASRLMRGLWLVLSSFTHDLQSLVETPSGLIAPTSAVEHALLAALLAASVPLALSFVQGRSPFSWLHSAQPAWIHWALHQKFSCTSPDRLVSSHRCSRSPASAVGLSQPPAAAADPSASAALPGKSRSPCGTAEARRRKRDKHRRRNRRHSKRSMWREIQRLVFACLAMWACCAGSSSDDDEHNTGHTCCSCLPMPSPRPPCSRTSRSWMSSWWPCRAGSPSTFSP